MWGIGNQSVKTFSSSPSMAWQHFLADAKIIFIGLPTQSICHPFNCISIICLSLPTPDPYKPDSTVSCYLFSWLTKVHLIPPSLQSPAHSNTQKSKSHVTLWCRKKGMCGKRVMVAHFGWVMGLKRVMTIHLWKTLFQKRVMTAVLVWHDPKESNDTQKWMGQSLLSLDKS